MIFCNLLNLATKETFFMFNNKYYKQVGGVANIFMCSFEIRWLRDCINNFKFVFYRRYIDNMFVQLSSPDHADKFREYSWSKHPNIKCSIDKTEDGCLPFLDITIFCENEKRVSKKTISGVYAIFKSFILETCKMGFPNSCNQQQQQLQSHVNGESSNQ